MPANFWGSVVAATCFGFYANSGFVGVGTFAALFAVCLTVELARDAIVDAIRKRL